MSFNPSLHPLCDIESLSDNATAFSNRSKQLRRQMWWRGCKVSKPEAHGKTGQHLRAVQSPEGKAPDYKLSEDRDYGCLTFHYVF